MDQQTGCKIRSNVFRFRQQEITSSQMFPGCNSTIRGSWWWDRTPLKSGAKWKNHLFLHRLWNNAYSRTMGSGLCGRIRAITRQDEQQTQICESVEKWASGFCVHVHKSTASASQRGLWGFKVTIKLRMWMRAGELSWLAVRELEKSQSKHAKCNYVFRFEMACWGWRVLSAAADRTAIILGEKWNNWKMGGAGGYRVQSLLSEVIIPSSRVFVSLVVFYPEWW